MEKHYFAAANTGKGFYSCFDYINDKRRDGFLYILKGGPGTGKSTLMKKVGKHFHDQGESIEYFHCSSDEKSLDGVRITNANIAIVDGTAPHVIEAQMPGITDGIINLGEFIRSEIKEYKDKIQELILRKKEWFNIAYSYISAAAQLDAANMKAQAAQTNKESIKKTVENIFESLNLESVKENCAGSERRLFLSTVSETGRLSYRSVNKYSKIIGIKGNEYAARLTLDGIAVRLALEGHSFTSFCDILNPENREAVQIDTSDTLIVLDSDKCDMAVMADETLIFETNTFEDSFLCGGETVNKILQLSAKAMGQAKVAHAEIEACYVKAMDFNGLNNITEYIINSCKQP